jgi:hypothetical protein
MITVSTLAANCLRTRENISSRIIACHSATRVPSGEGEAEESPLSRRGFFTRCARSE